MKVAVVALVLMQLLIPTLGYADIPDQVLDKDYDACMGNDTDTNRAAYCLCIRNGMKDWNVEDYTQTASEAATSSSQNNAIPARIEDLARGCIASVLR